ncbi:hypothetical protein QWY92_09285 [Algibacter miyuki]|nr:hypothetical protein [Algibacter miyuki]
MIVVIEVLANIKNEIENLTEKSDIFSQKLEKLKEEHPNFSNEIEKSDGIIYQNGIPKLDIHNELLGKEIHSKILKIFNNIYN